MPRILSLHGEPNRWRELLATPFAPETANESGNQPTIPPRQPRNQHQVASATGMRAWGRGGGAGSSLQSPSHLHKPTMATVSCNVQPPVLQPATQFRRAATDRVARHQGPGPTSVAPVPAYAGGRGPVPRPAAGLGRPFRPQVQLPVQQPVALGPGIDQPSPGSCPPCPACPGWTPPWPPSPSPSCRNREPSDGQTGRTDSGHLWSLRICCTTPKFHCVDGVVLDADANAACNIRERLHDDESTLWMPWRSRPCSWNEPGLRWGLLHLDSSCGNLQRGPYQPRANHPHQYRTVLAKGTVPLCFNPPVAPIVSPRSDME